MFTPTGKFAWYEFMTSDTKSAGKFYSDVVGWSTREMKNEDSGEYITFNTQDRGIAGMLNLPGHTAWVGYISVPDVDAHVERIVAAGGKLWKGPTDVPGMLRFAVLSDPQGAAIVVFTSHPAMPSPPPLAPRTDGTIGWHELVTTDLEGAFRFYSEMFGWTKLSDMDMGSMGIYRIFDEGDHKPLGDGGMMTKPPHIPTPAWTFYFHVDSIGAAADRVRAGGGKVLNGPMQVPGGDWVIQGQDPLGATFALVSGKA